MSVARREQIPPLSKSRFNYGLQCHKRLYLECFNRELADPVDEQQQALFDTGHEVGELARKLYTSGLLIKEDHLHHADAMISTNAVLSDATLPALFEAAFLHDDIRIRADILARADDGCFDLIEFKSGAQIKDENIPDAGVQLFVLNGCGIQVRRTCIGHLNKEYIYPGGEYDLGQLFCIEDVTDQVLQWQPEIPMLLDEMRRPLWNPEPPDIKAGRQCSRPNKCSFHGHCHADEPEHPAGKLPMASEKLLQSLAEAGIADIRDIPDGFAGLNATQKRVRDCVINDCLYLESELAHHLQQLEYPIHFLDFETFSPALPIYVGTRPYQVIAFQWSNHILEKSGELRHEQFLYDGTDDPRESLAKSLLKTLGSRGSIVVYSSFEATRIRELAAAFPGMSADLLSLHDRVVDLLQLVRKHCYHPAFHGSFSIKTVLPALVPDLDYSDLEINDGILASLAYAEMRRPETTPGRRESLKQGLLAYCKRDTEAEVRLFQTLCR